MELTKLGYFLFGHIMDGTLRFPCRYKPPVLSLDTLVNLVDIVCNIQCRFDLPVLAAAQLIFLRELQEHTFH